MEEWQVKQLAEQLQKPTGEEGIKTGLWMNERNAAMNKDAIAVLNPSSGDKILELGMGIGHFVKDILAIDKSITYSGCDFSEEMVTESIKINQAWVVQNRASFLQGDIAQLPYSSTTFNKIFSVNTIYFWQDPAKNLAEIARVLEDKGRLFLSFRPKHIMEKMMVTKYGFRLYSIADVVQLVAHHGFEVTDSIENSESPIAINGITTLMGNAIVVAHKI